MSFCNSEYFKNYYLNHKDKLKNYAKQYYFFNKKNTNKKYYYTNRDIILKKQMDYYYNNTEKIIQRQMDYYYKNNEKIIQKQKEYYYKNKKNSNKLGRPKKKQPEFNIMYGSFIITFD